ncbi:fungal-specific transcription factor domain-containing protein [Lasiosphaeria miniovina]|uniref:Fungal-specific transcription factor domain-containing protein n=1 Tax=Lasiosphaeria miniovina TaxID=1954250 RepID=A0AA39ZZ64_9PEZI|nr:fungal-specific transcription factor domain-containing protein [Lasiosphaeria miniovina]KAK0706346.1 fungal-specific transcription factor domain-containing protein [Lasiosphaeria miniovina]
MLLYTRRAAPKEPKRRSRAGDTPNQLMGEQKKKCDERRPRCTRCSEHSFDCVYETVQPRQRRKRESLPPIRTSVLSSEYTSSRKLSEVSLASDDSRRPSWGEWDHGSVVLSFLSDAIASSPSESVYDSGPLVKFSRVDYSGTSPVGVRSPVSLVEANGGDSGPAMGLHQDSGVVAIAPQSRSLHPDLAMIAPCPVGSPLFDFCPPAFSEFSDRRSRRALVDHFCNVLSHLIVFREETGNPFQQLLLPLTRKDSPVTNAIYALASAHLECRGVENAEKSLYFHNQAIQGVAQLIEPNSTVNRNEILAAIMLLVYYEVLVQKGRSNIVAGHLKGALTIMCTNPEPSDPTSVFLERAFRFYDVIAALSNGTPPLSAAPTPDCLLPLSPLGASAGSPLCNVDALLGMATTLWPIIHRLSNLLSMKTELQLAVRTNAITPKIAVLRTEFETTAGAIEAALTRWEPHLAPILKCAAGNSPTMRPTIGLAPTTRDRIHSIRNNALAYRHSAFVYLYRTIYGCSRSHNVVQMHTHLSLVHCVETVCHAGPMGALLWPLFVAACEAVSAEDRELADQAFSAVNQRQGMRNIERAWMIVREVWRRADLAAATEDRGETSSEHATVASPARNCFYNNKGNENGGATDLWRQVSREMGVNIVFG